MMKVCFFHSNFASRPFQPPVFLFGKKLVRIHVFHLNIRLLLYNYLSKILFVIGSVMPLNRSSDVTSADNLVFIWFITLF